MILLNPKQYAREASDERSREIMQKTISFFEDRGLARLKEDFHERNWYADFVEFMAEEKILADMMMEIGQFVDPAAAGVLSNTVVVTATDAEVYGGSGVGNYGGVDTVPVEVPGVNTHISFMLED